MGFHLHVYLPRVIQNWWEGNRHMTMIHTEYKKLLVWVEYWNIEAKTNGSHVTDNIFKCIFFTESHRILIETSIKFYPKGPVDNMLALVQIAAIIWTGDGLGYRHMYSSLSIDELNTLRHQKRVDIMQKYVLYIYVMTVKITGPQTADDKTHVRPVNLLYIIMFKIWKMKPNLS